MAWEDISSTEYNASCGDSAGHTASEMLDSTDEWWHVVNHTHTLTLDMGTSKIISKIKTKRDGVGGSLPTTITIYVSDTIGTWGTAVDTIDLTGDSGVNWTERTLATASTGRYIYLEIETEHGTNYLGWGDSAQKVLDFFTGAIPKRWTSVINLVALNYTTSSASYVPSDGSICLLDWDGSKYSNIIHAYFEVNGNIVGASEGDTWQVQLYDRTNTTELSNVSKISAGIARSGDMSSSLPSGSATLDVRIKNNGASSVAVKSARLIIVQEEDTTDKMRIYLTVGQGYNARGTTYNSGSGEFAADCEHQYKFLDNNFSSISAAYFHANIKAAATTTTFVKLDTVGQTNSMGVMSTTNTTPTLKISGDIKSSLTDAEIYTMYMKSSGARTSATGYNGWIVLELNPVTKFEFTYDIAAFGKRETSNTGWQTHNDYQLTYSTGDVWCYDCASETVSHAVVSGHSSATNIITAVYDDGTRDSTSEQTETSGGANYNEDATIATIADDSTIKAGWNVNALPLLANGIMYMSNLLVQIEISTSGTNTQINIGDEWKTIEEMQINIGDVWKTVAGTQINIGDAWKTIY